MVQIVRMMCASVSRYMVDATVTSMRIWIQLPILAVNHVDPMRFMREMYRGVHLAFTGLFTEGLSPIF